MTRSIDSASAIEAGKNAAPASDKFNRFETPALRDQTTAAGVSTPYNSAYSSFHGEVYTFNGNDNRAPSYRYPGSTSDERNRDPYAGRSTPDYNRDPGEHSRAVSPPPVSQRQYISDLYSNPEHLKKTLDSLYEKYDLSRDGLIDDNEASRIKYDSTNKSDLVIADLVLQEKPWIERQHNDVFGFEDESGLSKTDITDFIKASNIFDSKYDQAKNVGANASDLFPKLDANKDGFVDLTELDVKTLENRNIKVGQNDFNAIAAMKSLYPELLGANNDEYGFENNGLTYADMINSSSRISDLYKGVPIMQVNYQMGKWWS